MSHAENAVPGDRVRRRRFLQWSGATAAAGLVAGARGQPAARAAFAGQPAAGKAIQLGLASYTTRKLSLDETLRITRRVGLRYICLKSVHLPLDAGPDAIAAVADRVRRSGLRLYGGGVITMQKPAQVHQAFAYARAAGMELIVAAPNREMLPLIESNVKASNIAVAIHNHGPGDRHFPTPDSAYEAVKHLDRRLGLCIDIGHTVRAGVDLVPSTRKCVDRLLDVHLKDLAARAPRSRDVPVGRGVIDVPGFLRTLVQANYAGHVSFEYEPEPDDPLPGLAESVGFTRGVLAMV